MLRDHHKPGRLRMNLVRIIGFVGLCLAAVPVMAQVKPASEIPRLRQPGSIAPSSAAPTPPVRVSTAALRMLELPDDPAPASGRTLEDLEQTALANNPTLDLIANRIHALRGKWLQAGLPPNPVIGYSGEDIGEEGAAGKHGAFIGKEFVTAGKLEKDRQIVCYEIERGEQQWEAQRWKVLTDVRLGFYDVLLSQRQRELTKKLVAIGDEGVRTVEELKKGGEATDIEVLQARVEADSTRLLLGRARTRHEAAWRKLAAVLGTPDAEMEPLTGDLDDDRPDISWDGALDRLKTESPQLAAANASVERAKWVLSRAQAGRFPNVEAQVSLHRDAASGETLTGVEVALPLPILNRNQGEIARASAELIASQREVHRVELNLQRRLAAVYQRYADAREEVDKYFNDILPNVKKTLRLATTAYKAGEFSYLEYITVQRTNFQTNLAYIRSLREMWSATVEINGLLLAESLEASE